MEKPENPVLEMRVALTAQNYERLSLFYTEGLGLTPEHLWTGGEDRALMVSLGQATLEIFDEPHAAVVDQIEMGRRVSGSVRFALRVSDLEIAVKRARAFGGTLVNPAVTTPWGHRNARLMDPEGMQITLFQVL